MISTRRPPPFVGSRPVRPGDFPDPFVLRVGESYVAFATQAGGTNVQVAVSPDLARWEPAGDALPVLPAWAAPGRTWAPAVLPRGDAFVLYATVRDARSGRQGIAAATAESPTGPYRDTGAGPLVLQAERGGSIDASPFVDEDGRAHLLWKSDDNAVGRPSSLWGQPLAEDGLALVGSATELLRHDRSWERPLIEGPTMVRVDGRYHLFYSAGWWESAGYAIGYAVGDGVLGPFRKATTRGPWLASGPDAAGPGGQELFTDADGALRMAYHAWSPDRVGYAAGGERSLRIDRVVFVGGRPAVAG